MIRSGGVFDVPGKQEQIAQLDQKAADPGIWEDPQVAQQMMRQLFELKDMVAAWDGLAQRVEDGLELLALAEAEGDVETEQAIAVDAEEILSLIHI